MARFEILEHTADVGIKAEAVDLPGVFEQATLGLLEITGAGAASSREGITIEVEANDLGALLVDWLEEVLYLQDARDAVVGDVSVDRVSDGRAHGSVAIAPRDRDLEGTAVKAITYHQLSVEEADGNWIAVVYFDI